MHPVEVISKLATFRKQQQQLTEEQHQFLLRQGWVAHPVSNVTGSSAIYIKLDPDDCEKCCSVSAALKYEEEWAEAEITAKPVATEPAPPPPLALTTSYLVSPDIV